MRRVRFEDACRAIFRTAPVTFDASSRFVLVSQLQHKDVLMYLLAVKSFTKRVQPSAVYLIDDGTLTAEDRAKLKDHVPRVTFFSLAAFQSAACPRGGCWERLLAISTLVAESHVIQLDSDTLTIGRIEEVRNALERGLSFTLATWDRQKTESMRERAEKAKKVRAQGNDHIQVVAEASFDKLDHFESLLYVRGCAGFAGFACGSFDRAFMEEISRQMRSAIGERWTEWGSEQVMSNILVANSPNAVVLPHPKYADCHKMKAEVTEFVHFIGSCRFDGGNYGRLGAQVIATL
jgi:hypothetical protein